MQRPFWLNVNLLFQHADSIGDGLFHSLPAVLVHIGLVLVAVGQAAGAANAATDTGLSLIQI